MGIIDIESLPIKHYKKDPKYQKEKKKRDEILNFIDNHELTHIETIATKTFIENSHRNNENEDNNKNMQRRVSLHRNSIVKLDPSFMYSSGQKRKGSSPLKKHYQKSNNQSDEENNNNSS